MGHARAEDKKLIKELTYGGPCLEGTLQEPAIAPLLNRSLVAEANFSGIYSMSAASEKIQPADSKLPENIKFAGRARELRKRPTSHPIALGLLFIPEVGEKVQGGIDFFARKFMALVPMI